MNGRARPGTGWPHHVGVAGLSVHAATASYGQRLATTATDAVATWAGPADAAGAGPAAEFPYATVLGHFRAVGRLAASASLVGTLTRLPVPDTEADDRAAARLAIWLRSATDQLDGDYHTYAGTTLIEDLLDDAPAGGAAPAADSLLLTLLVDLLRTEAQALAAAPSRVQRKRVKAVVHAVRRCRRLAPAAADAAPDLAGTVDALTGDAQDRQVAELAARAAEAAELPSAAVQVSDLAMLPATVLHDEQMFLRCIQVFECLYLQSAWRIEAAATALCEGDPVRATALLRATAERLEATSAVYRVLTTMPPATFAIIRKHTSGRSAVQSRTYRRVERSCAPAGDASAPAGRPSLQEAFLRAGPRLPVKGVERVRATMDRVDTAWRQMKRTHWGITLKTIGQATGTGGTAGASYLEQTARIPLFPALNGRG